MLVVRWSDIYLPCLPGMLFLSILVDGGGVWLFTLKALVLHWFGTQSRYNACLTCHFIRMRDAGVRWPDGSESASRAVRVDLTDGWAGSIQSPNGEQQWGTANADNVML